MQSTKENIKWSILLIEKFGLTSVKHLNYFGYLLQEVKLNS